MLAGHSFGGLLALHAWSSGRGFRAYAAVSPSLWYGSAAQLPPGPPEQCVLLAGTTMGEGDPVAALVERWREDGRCIDHEPLPGQSHGGSMLAAMAV